MTSLPGDDRDEVPAVWSRWSKLDADRSASGAGSAPPGLSAAEVIEVRVAATVAIGHINEVSYLLADALSPRPGVLAQITVAVFILRIAADELEALTRREGGG